MKSMKYKDASRNKIISQRNQLDKNSQYNKSKQITQQVLTSNTFASARNIGFYHAVKGEADPGGLTAINQNKQFYLPIISSKSDQPLLFAPINKSTQYKMNRYSIPEPLYQEKDLVSGQELDLVILPLVAFDHHGNRLGMGGGYYDRTFAFKKKKVKKPTLLGFAYDFQEFESITPEPWDIPLDMLATESRFLIFNN